MPAEIRQARLADVQDLYELDALVFGSSDLGHEPAASEEFESGLQSGGVRVAVQDSKIVGFAQVEPLGDMSLFLASLAVHPSHRHDGIGRDLLQDVLQYADRIHLPVTTATSPGNVKMLSLLLDNGFVAVDYLDDYYGHGKHRVVLDRFADRLIRTTVDTRLIPMDSTDTVRAQLKQDGWVIEGIHKVGVRDYASIGKLDVRDREDFKADEFHAGMAFSGTVLAALTFLLGFAITSTRFSDDIRVLLAVAVTASLFSLVVYANASGDLARFDSDRFVRHMEVGNIISEYGGIVPLLVIVPVSLMPVVDTDLARWTLGLSGTLILVLYFWSTFSLWTRYRRRWWSWMFITIIVASPFLWLVVASEFVPSIIWTASVVASLVAATLDLHFSPGESSPPSAAPKS